MKELCLTSCLLIASVAVLASLFGAQPDRPNADSDHKHGQPKYKTFVAAASFQQGSVDNFSNDQRAISPREWGDYHTSSDNELQAPPVEFDSSPIPERASRQRQNNRPMRQVESKQLRKTKEFFETQPLRGDANGRYKPEFSSPVPHASNVIENSAESKTTESQIQHQYAANGPGLLDQETTAREFSRPVDNSEFELESREPTQGIVDHFSNDRRAMSPRQWGSYHPYDSGGEPQSPRTVFDSPRGKTLDAGSTPRFQQVENERLVEPKEYFESKPLVQDQANRPESSSPTPLPKADEKKATKDAVDDQDVQPVESVVDPDAASEVFTEPEKFFQQVHQHQPFSPLVSDSGHVCQDCRLFQDLTVADTISGRCRERRQIGRRRKPGEFNNGIGLRSNAKRRRNRRDDCSAGTVREVEFPDFQPKYNRHLGHRDTVPTTRGFLGSSAEKFSFEEDGTFPPASEILANSIFFSEMEFLYLQPGFQGNTAITTVGPGGSYSAPFNFDLEPAFRVMAGFESDYGPGFAGEYFQFDNDSDFASFTSNGANTGETRVYQLGPNRWTSLIADDIGESINALHSLEVHSTSVYAFKAIKFKRAYVRGRFGMQIVAVDQTLRAELLDVGGNQIGRLSNSSNLNAFGPRFGIDYVRKIGHTPAQLITSSTTSLLFGDRNQTVQNTFTNDFSSIGSDEFLTVIDIFFGVQTKKYRGEKRNTTIRVGFVNQTWLGGGTAIDPNGDFGFQGISMMLGINR